MRPQDAGVTSATVNTSQQVGGSIGTALLNTIATSVTTGYMASHAGRMTPRTAKAGLVEGFSHAFVVSSSILVGAAVVIALLMNTPRPVREPGAEGATRCPRIWADGASPF